MTNGNVEHAVTGVDGPVLSVKYKDGEKKLVVTPQTVVVTYEMGKREEVQPGTRIFVGAAKKQADGPLQTPRITYGRHGEGPLSELRDRGRGGPAGGCPEHDRLAVGHEAMPCDLDAVTDRRRPHGLVCSKSQASYDKLREQCQRDLENLAALDG